jgi:hypothetical protein
MSTDNGASIFRGKVVASPSFIEMSVRYTKTSEPVHISTTPCSIDRNCYEIMLLMSLHVCHLTVNAAHIFTLSCKMSIAVPYHIYKDSLRTNKPLTLFAFDFIDFLTKCI